MHGNWGCCDINASLVDWSQIGLDGDVTMRVAGHFNFPDPPATVFQAFLNKEALIAATPGLQSLEEVAPDQYTAVLRTGIGGFYLLYYGTLVVSERVPDQGYRLQVEAKTHNGHATVDMRIQFQARPHGGTRVDYDADLELGGAQKLLPSLARGMVDFFMHGMLEWMKEQADERRPEMV